MKAPAEAEAHTSHPNLTPTPDAVEEARSYQRASRRVIRDSTLTIQQACVALIRLAVRAREEAEAPDMCQAAIWGEAKTFVANGERPLDREAIVEALHAADPVELTIRRLLRDGYARCPRCTRLLPTDAELDHRRTLARASLEEALLREDAV